MDHGEEAKGLDERGPCLAEAAAFNEAPCPQRNQQELGQANRAWDREAPASSIPALQPTWPDHLITRRSSSEPALVDAAAAAGWTPDGISPDVVTWIPVLAPVEVAGPSMPPPATTTAAMLPILPAVVQGPLQPPPAGPFLAKTQAVWGALAVPSGLSSRMSSELAPADTQRTSSHPQTPELLDTGSFPDQEQLLQERHSAAGTSSASGAGSSVATGGAPQQHVGPSPLGRTLTPGWQRMMAALASPFAHPPAHLVASAAAAGEGGATTPASPAAGAPYSPVAVATTSIAAFSAPSGVSVAITQRSSPYPRGREADTAARAVTAAMSRPGPIRCSTANSILQSAPHAERSPAANAATSSISAELASWGNMQAAASYMVAESCELHDLAYPEPIVSPGALPPQLLTTFMQHRGRAVPVAPHIAQHHQGAAYTPLLLSSTHPRTQPQQAVCFHEELTADLHPETIYEGDTSSGKASSNNSCSGQSPTATATPSAATFIDSRASISADFCEAHTPEEPSHMAGMDRTIQRATVQARSVDLIAALFFGALTLLPAIPLVTQKDWGQLGTHLAFNFAWFSPYLVLLTGLIAWAPAKDFYIHHRDELMLASDAIKPLLSVLVLCGKLAFPSEWKQFTSGFMDAPMLCLLRPVAVQMRSKYALLEALITWLPDAHMYMHLVYWEGRPFLPALLISLARAGVQVLFAAGLQALLDWRSQGQISKQAAAKGTPAPVSNSVSQKIESLNGTLSHDKSAGAYLKGHTSPCKESSNKGYSSTACSAAPSKLLDAADCEPIKCGATGDAQTPAAAAAARPNDEGRVIQRAAAQARSVDLIAALFFGALTLVPAIPLATQSKWVELGTHLAFNFAWFSPYLVLLTGVIAWAPAKDFYICHRDELMLASDVIKPLLSVLVLCGKLAFPSEWKQFTSGFMDAPMLCLLRPVAIQMRSKYALLEALITWLPDAHMYMHLVYWEGRPFLPALLISLARAGVQVLFAAGLQALLDWRSQGQISKQAAAKGTAATAHPAAKMMTSPGNTAPFKGQQAAEDGPNCGVSPATHYRTVGHTKVE